MPPRKPKTPAAATPPIDPNAPPAPPPAPRTPEQDRIGLQRKVKMLYDLQRLRIQAAGRGLKKGVDNPIQLHEFDVEVLNRRAIDLRTAEAGALADVAEHLKTIGFYNAVLSDKVRYRGIGPTMAGVILSSFDIYREDTASKMWAFAGLAPVPARRCKACCTVVELEPNTDESEASQRWKHVVARAPPGFTARDAIAEEEATPAVLARAEEATPPDVLSRAGKARGKPKKADVQASPVCAARISLSQTFESAKAMRPVKGELLKYNAFLKTKLVGVLGPVLLKVNSPWRKFYDDYKHRKESAGWGRNDGHRHNAAIRYMVKMLLLDIWRAWRGYLGLSVRPSYQEEKLGHVHNNAGGPASPVDSTRAVDCAPPDEFTRAVELASPKDSTRAVAQAKPKPSTRAGKPASPEATTRVSAAVPASPDETAHAAEIDAALAEVADG